MSARLPRTGFLVSTFEAPGGAVRAAGERLEPVEEDALLASPPEAWTGLIVSMHADQVFLHRHAGWFARFLDRGGRLAVSGHIERPFVAGLAPFVPLVRPGLDDLRVTRLAPHPVFDAWTGEELTTRRGVAGFFGRGHNPPPDRALLVNGLGPARVPVDWDWTRPGGGRLLVHGGNDLWVTFEEPAKNARLVGSLLDWLEAEAGPA